MGKGMDMAREAKKTYQQIFESSSICVVLVEPRIPQNVGTIARLCVCTGAELYLVGSLGFRMGDKFLARAGMDYVDQIKIHHVLDFNEVLEAKPGYTPYYFSTKTTQHFTDVTYPEKVMLVFGSESHGLPEWVLAENPETTVRIPMIASPEARSLNISTSVGIAVYEVCRQLQASSLGQS